MLGAEGSNNKRTQAGCLGQRVGCFVAEASNKRTQDQLFAAEASNAEVTRLDNSHTTCALIHL